MSLLIAPNLFKLFSNGYGSLCISFFMFCSLYEQVVIFQKSVKYVLANVESICQCNIKSIYKNNLVRWPSIEAQKNLRQKEISLDIH